MQEEQQKAGEQQQRTSEGMEARNNRLQSLVQQQQGLSIQLIGGEISQAEFNSRNAKLKQEMDEALQQAKGDAERAQQSAAVMDASTEQYQAREKELEEQYKPRLDAARKAADEENKPTRQALVKLKEPYELSFMDQRLHCPDESP